MPLQNRVLPTGRIVSDPARGMFTGNRGIIHRPDRTLGTSRWSHKHWLICTLTHPRGTYHGPMPDRRWTALFFLDEAVGLSAGHRPCNYCRRGAYQAFKQAWTAGTTEPSDHKHMDDVLHAARVTRKRAQIRHQAPVETLPNGAFILWNGTPHLLWDDHILPYTPAGYDGAIARPQGMVTVLTPKPTLAVLQAGYAPHIHTSAHLSRHTFTPIVHGTGQA